MAEVGRDMWEGLLTGYATDTVDPFHPSNGYHYARLGEGREGSFQRSFEPLWCGGVSCRMQYQGLLCHQKKWCDYDAAKDRMS